MAKFKGFFELQTPQDLLQKLRHDFERLGNHPWIHSPRLISL
jgi:hypothetical protein